MQPPLIFIPGVGGLDWLFDHQRRHLADVVETSVMVLDRQDTRAEMVEYVLAHAPPRFSIAGHSLGGWVAQAVAARAPERVACAFLCDTWTRPNPDAIAYIGDFADSLAADYDQALDEHFGVFLHQDLYAADPDACARMRTLQRGMPAEGYVRQLRALTRDYATEDLLAGIQADTLVIRGRQDRVINPEESVILANRIPRASLALIEGSGHVTPWEQPQAFTAVVRLWLERRR